jgi:hypothetical protein
MVYIYILELEQGKYYVGKTINPSFRLDSHFNQNGSAWTKLYKPIKMVELIPNCDDYDEDKYTRVFMDKYGIDNVRGGSFVSVELEQSTINHLTQMNNGTNDKCFKCGKPGHFAKDCKNKKEIIEVKDESCSCPTSYFSGHRRSQCLLLNTINSIKENEVLCCDYCHKEFTDKRKCEYHERSCKYNNEESESEEEYDVVCFRCGREGHYANSCYASKHIRGYYLR